MNGLTGICITLLVLTVVVTIHEFGHFLACRLMKVRVEKFSVGLGPKLFGFESSKTKWQIGALPLGGYVQMNEADMAEAHWLAKAFIAVAGPLANLLPFAILGAAFGFLGKFISALWNIYVTSFIALGKVFAAPFIWMASWFSSAAPVVKDVANSETLTGPIGITQIAAQSHQGFWMTGAVLFVAISLGIAMINLIPVPPLDGGRIVIALSEGALGKRISKKIDGVLSGFGVLALLYLFVIITFRDIVRLF